MQFRFPISKRTILSVIIVCLVCSNSLRAQENDSPFKDAYRRWTVSIYLGFASRGPATAFEGLMISNGFDANDGQIGNSLGKDHPYSLTGTNFQRGAPWMLTTYYRFKSPFVIGAIFSHTQIGTTYGHQTSGSFNTYLDISYSVTAFSSVLAVQAGDILQIGIGPALYSPQTSADSFRTVDRSSIDSRIGLLVDFSLAVPSKSHFFGEVKIQYRSVGQVKVGPWNQEGLASSTLDAIDVNYDHWFFGLGFGFTFQ